MRTRIAVVAWLVAVAVALVQAALAGPGPARVIETIEVALPQARAFDELDPREQREQLRDWAVHAVVARIAPTPEAAAAASFELPPVRLPYLDELYAFEHGRGRRAYAAGRVLLFHDADDPDPQATLGRLADRVRAESGELPAALEHYVVRDDRAEGAIRIERRTDLRRDDLFGAAYGYVELTVRDVPSLEAWLARADDLVSVRQAPGGGLVLGGRRFATTRTENLGAEDIAALFQAHERLAKDRDAARARRIAWPAALRERVDRYVEAWNAGDRDAAAAILAGLPPAQRDQVRAALFAGSSDDGPGFSLDPEWLPDPKVPGAPLMLARLRGFVADPCADVQALAQRATAFERAEPDETRRTATAVMAIRLRDRLRSIPPDACKRVASFAPALQQVIAKVERASPDEWADALAGYHDVIERASRVPGMKLAAALAHAALAVHSNETSVQCARYFGLAGTRAGMTLFYTDLLAKLWLAIDRGRSAPVAAVPGFVSVPHLDVPAVFAGDPVGTRLWFGPRAEGVARVEASATTYFEHRFVRVYAAGSNPSAPAQESQPNEASRRALGWWDRHYDEVADHEPQYHRLNQILKWALVTANAHGTNTAAFLGTAAVRRDLGFFSWHGRQCDRFREKIVPASPTIAGRECLPLLASYWFPTDGARATITGGVSTVSSRSAGRVPLVDPRAALGARRRGAPDLGAGTAGTATRPQRVLAGSKVTFAGAGQARTRTLDADVAIGAPEVRYQRGAGAGSLRLEVGERAKPIGALVLTQAARPQEARTRIELAWAEERVEQTRLGAPPTGPRGPPPEVTGTGPGAQQARALIASARARHAAPAKRALDGLAPSALAPAERAVVEQALGEVATAAALEHASAALRGAKPAGPGAADTLVVAGDRIVRHREIGAPAVAPLRRPEALQLDASADAIFYVDASLISREGVVVDLGGSVEGLTAREDVTAAKLLQPGLGDTLPDQLQITGERRELVRVERTRGQWHTPRAAHRRQARATSPPGSAGGAGAGAGAGGAGAGAGAGAGGDAGGGGSAPSAILVIRPAPTSAGAACVEQP